MMTYRKVYKYKVSVKIMAPIIEVSNEDLKSFNQLGLKYKLRNDLEDKSAFNESDFVYIPLINLYVAKERSLIGKNWYETHRELQSKEERMLTIPEFI